MLETVLDWLYPPKCGLCHRIGRDAICDSCLKEFIPATPQVETPAQVDQVTALYMYEGRASQAVKELKFGRVTSLARPMAEQMASFAREREFFECSVIVPIPVSPGRERERGFSQADLLAEAMPDELLDRGLLRRTRYTRPQVGLKRDERLGHLADAFSTSGSIPGLSILLIDDVVTTGGTASACAGALKLAGASSVKLLAYAAEPMR